MSLRTRWRRIDTGEVAAVRDRLERWPCAPGGAVRHMFPLSALEAFGADVVRVVERGEGWAAAVLLPGRVLAPCGDAEVLRAAGTPMRRWRLVVGDAAAADAVLPAPGEDPSARIHVQRFLTVDPALVPDEADLPDPGLRRATRADLDALADLAVELHVDDGFGPDPGRVGWRGYAARLATSIDRGSVACVGPVGRPLAKLERSVSSRRLGVQLAGIVVARAHRGAGIGGAMVAAGVRQAQRELPSGRAITLHVRADNAPALAAYARAGFRDAEAWRLAVRA